LPLLILVSPSWSREESVKLRLVLRRRAAADADAEAELRLMLPSSASATPMFPLSSRPKACSRTCEHMASTSYGRVKYKARLVLPLMNKNKYTVLEDLARPKNHRYTRQSTEKYGRQGGRKEGALRKRKKKG